MDLVVMMSFWGGIEEEKALHRVYDELLRWDWGGKGSSSNL
jgi:hypothetical protein